MPPNERHREYTYGKLGVSGWDIHYWMDALWLEYGAVTGGDSSHYYYYGRKQEKQQLKLFMMVKELLETL